jgi:hypothetical protein
LPEPLLPIKATTDPLGISNEILSNLNSPIFNSRLATLIILEFIEIPPY